MLFEALEAASAWRILHDPKSSEELDSEAILSLMRAAGYPEAAAQKVASNRAFERVKRDLTP